MEPYQPPEAPSRPLAITISPPRGCPLSFQQHQLVLIALVLYINRIVPYALFRVAVSVHCVCNPSTAPRAVVGDAIPSCTIFHRVWKNTTYSPILLSVGIWVQSGLGYFEEACCDHPPALLCVPWCRCVHSAIRSVTGSWRAGHGVCLTSERVAKPCSQVVPSVTHVPAASENFSHHPSTWDFPSCKLQPCWRVL